MRANSTCVVCFNTRSKDTVRHERIVQEIIGVSGPGHETETKVDSEKEDGEISDSDNGE
jgi:hypothetical protein